LTVLRSQSNARVRTWAALGSDARARREANRTILEGLHLLEVCIARHVPLLEVLVSESGLQNRDVRSVLALMERPPVVLSDALFRTLSLSQTPVGIAAVIGISGSQLSLRKVQTCLFLDGIQDAGNVGAILRSAAAFAVPQVVLGPGCADVWSPKTLRAGMGAHFHLDIAVTGSIAESMLDFGGRVFATQATGDVSLEGVDLGGRVAWIFGSEGRGVSPELLDAAHARLCVPMPGGTESLNVAACAAICLYERFRQISTGAAQS